MIFSRSAGSKARRRLGHVVLVCAAAAGAIGSTATTATADTPIATFTLNQPDWWLGQTAASGSVRQLSFLNDGNLVLYGFDGETDYPLWASGTSGKGVTHLDWSQSGYVKLLDSSGNIVCTMGALNPAPGGHAELQDTGDLVFYDVNGNVTWSTDSHSHRNLNYCYT
ncbi:hypothetical protein [Kitasatospora sp. GP82]|uniref:hypothetical protein n=1 Tax=Kitasatospora sp. GP82 TaxID=3035089 RepID=UPI002476E4E5|nr:hypothetical protein [Kitasatospora sp. GP82]MDH6129084.1 hypothetical protein [Kitasatospora sp. GP82]